LSKREEKKNKELNDPDPELETLKIAILEEERDIVERLGSERLRNKIRRYMHRGLI
jgi:hypothetical protein